LATETNAGPLRPPDLGRLTLDTPPLNAGLDRALGQVPITHHGRATIGGRYISVLIQQPLKLGLESPRNQVSGTLPDQVVQWVVRVYL